MADYIEGLPIEQMPKLTELNDTDKLIVEDDEDTKHMEVGTLKDYIGGIASMTEYFAVSDSPTFAPSHHGETIAIVGEAVIGKAICGDNGTWYDYVPDVEEDEYLWSAWLLKFVNGDEKWTDPLLMPITRVDDSQINKNAEEIENVKNLTDYLGQRISELEQKIKELEGGNEDDDG